MSDFSRLSRSGYLLDTRDLAGPVIFSAPVVKGGVRAFQNVHGGFADGVVLDCPAFVGDFIAMGLIEITADHLVSVTNDGKVRIVRNDNNLPSSPRLSDAINKQFHYRFIVEVLLGLVP